MSTNEMTLEAATLTFGKKVSAADLPKIVERSIIKAEMKNTGMKHNFAAAVRHSTIVSKVIVKRYKGLVSNGTRQSKKYIEEIESTMGRYAMHRPSDVRIGLRGIYEHIVGSMDVRKRNAGDREFGSVT